MLLVALKGRGSLRTGANETREVIAGETWLLPGAANSWDWGSGDGDWELLVARLPVRSAQVYAEKLERMTQVPT